MKSTIRILLAALWVAGVASFSATTTSTTTDIKSKSPIFEYLKFDKNPQFDVLAKSQEYVGTQSTAEVMSEDWYAEDYVLRGPVIGPINRSDLAKSQKGLGIRAAFPDIELNTFGFTIDPENPYRCFYFQRWRATHTGDLDNYGQIYPATNQEMETPVSCFSIVWNPDGKIVYEQVGAVIDRLEGNTEGKAAVFGMLHTAGLKLSANPGDKIFAFIQRIGHLAGNLGRSWSEEDEIPKWWISKSRGADATDVWE
mmetsp:Transcript_876/g.2044  ORF Transcript_876/g.2044 Transcript_876/m.2044 type:complete len:254 (-) Transcript_876:2364-3125(-)